MYEDVSATGARFTAVGVVTPDPASVESVLAWANRLQDRAQYLVVQNATSPQADFSYWDSAEQAIRFREALLGDAGIEPAWSRLRGECISHLCQSPTFNIKLVQDVGIEPTPRGYRPQARPSS